MPDHFPERCLSRDAAVLNEQIAFSLDAINLQAPCTRNRYQLADRDPRAVADVRISRRRVDRDRLRDGTPVASRGLRATNGKPRFDEIA